MDRQEGKVAFSFIAYTFLAFLFLTKLFQDASYSHLFFVLMWNLIARLITISTMKYEFMRQDNDMIIALPPKNKTDLTGERVMGKHIAANPFKPEIRPQLALARHVFSDGDRTAYSSVFSGDSYDGFGRAFHNAVRMEETRDHLDVHPEDIAKHSIPKTGATYCTSLYLAEGSFVEFIRTSSFPKLLL